MTKRNGDANHQVGRLLHSDYHLQSHAFHDDSSDSVPLQLLHLEIFLDGRPYRKSVELDHRYSLWWDQQTNYFRHATC